MDVVDPRFCYILDAVLLLYGVVLTVMYCRLRIQSKGEKSGLKKQVLDGGVYSDLTSPATDTYETINAVRTPVA